MIEESLRDLSKSNMLPDSHLAYLYKLKNEFNVNPNVIYDIGSCVLHWYKPAKKVWPNSKIYAFEAMDTVEFLYKENNIEYCIGVFSDIEDKELIFYQNNEQPGGNSYYKEMSAFTDIYFNKDSERLVNTKTIDKCVKEKNFQYPDLVKIDVQGCEIDILMGMQDTLKYCEHLIVQLQKVEYNKGAILIDQSIPIIESMGFELVTPLFSDNHVDGDYHFKRNIK